MKKLYITLLCIMLSFTAANAQYSRLVQKGDSCMDRYNTFDALNFYSEASDIDDNDKLKIKKGNCYFIRNDYRRCRDMLLAVPADSLPWKAMRQLFYSYGHLSAPAEQIKWGTKILEKNPKDGEVTADLAELYNRNEVQRYADAAVLTLKYLLEDSSDIAVMRQLANAEFFLKNFSQAKDTYKQLIAKGDSTFDNYFSLGMCCQQLHDTIGAYSALKKSAYLSEYKVPGCLARLGSICIDLASEKNKYGADDIYRYTHEGVEFLENALVLYENDPTIMYVANRSLGDGYYMEKKYLNAIKIWKTALEYRKNSVAVYYNIAQAYQVLGDKIHAESYYKAFLCWAYTLQDKSLSLKQMISAAENIVGKNSVKVGDIISPKD